MLLHTWNRLNRLNVELLDSHVRIEDEAEDFSLTLSVSEARALREKIDAVLLTHRIQTREVAS